MPGFAVLVERHAASLATLEDPSQPSAAGADIPRHADPSLPARAKTDISAAGAMFSPRFLLRIKVGGKKSAPLRSTCGRLNNEASIYPAKLRAIHQGLYIFIPRP